MTRIISHLKSCSTALYARGKQHPRKRAILIGILLALFVLLATSGNNTDDADKALETTPSVTVASVAALSLDAKPLILLGEVRSVSQAELRSQKSGKVTQVYVKAGQFVGAGAILAEIENAAERAQVLQAQGALQAARATLAKAEAGARGEDRASASVQTANAAITQAAAEESARTTYSQGYSLAQDAVFAQADDYFSNAYTVNPSFRIRTASYDEKQVLESERVTIGSLLNDWKTNTAQTIPSNELDMRLSEAQKDLERIKAFLNQISAFVSEQELSDDFTTSAKTAQEAGMLVARSSIDGARTAITSVRQGLASAKSAEIIASLNESKLVLGTRSEDLLAAEAVVTQARGLYAGALANLENALIRTPIAGTVSTFNVARGDFVPKQNIIAVVANPGALEIEVFVSNQAQGRITVGASVLIDGRFEGAVTSVAPGLDPATKKARVTVGLPAGAELTNGAFVEIAILDEATTETRATEVVTNEFRIPITAIKVLPRGLAVFTVSEEDTLVALPITEGPIIGSQMLVKVGLTPDTQIVIDVRGHAAGDQVTVETKN